MSATPIRSSVARKAAQQAAAQELAAVPQAETAQPSDDAAAQAEPQVIESAETSSLVHEERADDTAPAPAEEGPAVVAAAAEVVPGAGGYELVSPLVVAGIEWIIADGGPLASPIGAALAAEMAAAS